MKRRRLPGRFRYYNRLRAFWRGRRRCFTGEQLQRQTYLLGVGEVLGLVRAFRHTVEDRQRNAGQNGDDRDHDEEIY